MIYLYLLHYVSIQESRLNISNKIKKSVKTWNLLLTEVSFLITVKL